MNYDFDTIIERRHTACVKYKEQLMKNRPDDSIIMTLADMDLPVMKEVQDAMHQRCDHPVYGYGELKEELPKLVCSWYQERYDTPITPDSCVITPSVNTAIAWCIQTFTKPGDGILIQNPSYSPFRKNIILNNRRCLINELNYRNGQYEIDFQTFEEACKEASMFILCSPHNPISRVWSRDELKKMLNLCNQYHVLVISDEIHCDWCFQKPFLPAAMFQDSVITIVSGSKTFNLQGLETSFIFLPDKKMLADYQHTVAAISYMNNQCFSEAGFKAAYQHGDEWLNQAKEYVYGNYMYMINYFQQHHLKLSFSPLEATFLAWLDCSEYVQSEAEMIDLFENKCHIYGNTFTHFDCKHPFIRLNIGVSRKVIEDFCNRLAQVIQKENS
ncbi:MAG: aminotransferase class I/II-fold pyridoxal phosphate-dependent enzyme [Erysipelotrichaceae bacterium]|nr:aminotransferase class I/II-fold pyridoxal phosphate-dependent enzyme [Erysipelotrichaceae bacterium]